MTLSAKKYSDPTGVLKSTTDDFGQTIEIGDQKDIGEFNQTMLARIQEGLQSDKLVIRYFEEKEKEKQEEDVKMKEEEKSDSDAK